MLLSGGSEHLTIPEEGDNFGNLSAVSVERIDSAFGSASLPQAFLPALELAHFGGGKRVPPTMRAIANEAWRAEEIIKAVDERLPLGR
jgi:hypothetical protein